MVRGNRSIPVTLVVFDVLRVEGHDLMCTCGSNGGRCSMTWESSGRRAPLGRLDDGQVLFDAVVEQGLEGVVAKRRNRTYPRAIAAGRR